MSVKLLHTRRWVWIVVLLMAALFIRASFFKFVTGDMYFWAIPWFDYIAEHGYAALGAYIPNADGLEGILGGYTPPYHYLIYVATFFKDLIPKIYLIKIISVVFDFLAAFFIYSFAKRAVGRESAWRWFFAVLFAPTVIANGAMWGQCDAIPFSLLLGAVYFSVVRNPFWAVVFFGASFSFKATGIFLAPYLLMLVLRSYIPWRYLLLAPAAYAVMMAPAAILGRPITELAAIYWGQAHFFHKLSMNAPNLYQFAPNAYYAEISVAGIVLTCIISLGYAWLPRWKKVTLSPQFLVLAATLSVTMVPFLLPKMHDRYFMGADLVSIALVVFNPRLWFVPLLLQFSSMIAYIPIISDSITHFGGEYTKLNPLGAFINTALFVFLAKIYWSSTVRPKNSVSGTIAGMTENGISSGASSVKT